MTQARPLRAFGRRHRRQLVAAVLLLAFCVVAGKASAIEGPQVYGDWKRVSPPAFEDFSSIAFARDGSGWMFSPESGKLYRSTATQRWVVHETLVGDWRLIRDGERLPLFLIGGPHAQLRVYIEDEETWMQVISAGEQVTLHDVAALPIPRYSGGGYDWAEYAIVLVGEKRDGNSTAPYVATLQPPARGWMTASLLITGAATAVAVRAPFSVRERAVVVTADTALFISTDDGATFAPCAMPGYQDDRLLDVGFFDRDRGWAVGGDGALLSTRTGGQRWFSESRVTRDPFTSITLLDRDLFLFSAFGDGMGELWRMDITADRPEKVELPFNDTPRAIAADWRERRWLVGDRGMMYYQSKRENDRPLWEPQRIFPDRPFPQSDDEKHQSPTRQRGR